LNTNLQFHTDLVWSFQLEKTVPVRAIVLIVGVLVVLLVYVQKRRKASLRDQSREGEPPGGT
jgi:hypothetical protein